MSLSKGAAVYTAVPFYMLGGILMDTSIEFLYLSEQDMIDAGVLDAGRCVKVMEETIALLSNGDYLMGGPGHNAHGLMLEFPKKSVIDNFPLDDARDRRFIAMPAYLGGRFHVAGQKWYGSNGKNRKRGFPRSILMTSLNDVETGAPIAHMSANLLSAMRTGAMPGLAAKILAKPDSKVLTLVGPGVINKACLMAIMVNFKNIDTIYIKGSSVTSKTALSMKEFIERKYPQVKDIIICETLEQGVRPADIICEAASVSGNDWPKYKREWFKKGTVLISASVFQMEWDEMKDIVKVVDNYVMYEDYSKEDPILYNEDGSRKPTGCMGEDFVNMVAENFLPRNEIIELGDIITGKRKGRESEDDVIFVAIEGMPIEDIAWGYECYLRAKEKGIGTRLKLWDTPAMF